MTDLVARVARLVAVVAALMVLATGCVSSFPADAQGTLERATDGTL